MAITHVKVTYSVQPHTAQRVQELSTQWGVPKSEVIRRAVDDAAKAEALAPRLTPLQALNELMSSPSKLTEAEAKEFLREVRLSRRASSRKSSLRSEQAWKKYGKAVAAPRNDILPPAVKPSRVRA